MPTEDVIRLIPIEWIMVAVFVAGAIVRGIIMHKSTGSLDNLFLAGRKVPGLIASLSTVATNMNAGDFIGSAGIVYLVGALMVHGNLLHGIALIFVALVVMQKLRRLNAFTLGDWLEKRYCPAVGNTYSIVWAFVWMLFNLGFYLYVGAFVLEQLVGWDLRISIVCLSVIAAFYTLLGGFGAVIASDVLSVALMFFPFIFLACAVWAKVGGPAELAAALPTSKGDFWPTQTRFGPLGIAIFGIIFMHISYWTSEAQVVQRPLSSKSEEDASVSYIGASFWYTILVPLMISLPALAALKLWPNLPSNDMAMPMLIRQFIPRGLYGLVVVGLMAGVFSSADSQINAFCAMFTSEIYRKIFVPNRKKEHYLLVSKVAGILFTLAAIGTALLFSIGSVKDGMMLFAFSVLATIMPPFGAVTIMGSLFKRISKQGALAGVIAGMVVAIVLLVAFNIDYNKILVERYTNNTIESKGDNAAEVKVVFEQEHAQFTIDYEDEQKDDKTVAVPLEKRDQEGRLYRFAWFMCKTRTVIVHNVYFRTMVTFLTTVIVAFLVSVAIPSSKTGLTAPADTKITFTPTTVRLSLVLIALLIIMASIWTYVFCIGPK